MSVGFDNLKFFGQFSLCPAIGYISHNPSIKESRATQLVKLLVIRFHTPHIFMINANPKSYAIFLKLNIKAIFSLQKIMLANFHAFVGVPRQKPRLFKLENTATF
jgi:hypothetical protein